MATPPGSGGCLLARAPTRPLAVRPTRRRRRSGEQGVLALELVLTIPLVALVLVVLLGVLGVARDVLLVHEAARAAARAAATSAGVEPVRDAVAESGGRRGIEVRVDPPRRGAGDLVRVVTSVTTEAGPFRREVHATAVSRVEPGVGS